MMIIVNVQTEKNETENKPMILAKTEGRYLQKNNKLSYERLEEKE